jgi:hypothetical protein
MWFFDPIHEDGTISQDRSKAVEMCANKKEMIAYDVP